MRLDLGTGAYHHEVNVAYMIDVYKQDANGGNTSMLASRISSLDRGSGSQRVD